MIIYDDLLMMVAKEGNTYISTGMSTMEDIEKAVEILEKKIVHLNLCIQYQNIQ